MRKISPLKLLLGAIGLGVGLVGVMALREATLSTHTKPEGEAMELIVSGRTAGGETNQTLDEMVEAQLLTCRLEVTSDPAGPIEDLGDGRFRAVFVPAMDETNRRQFRGCVEDFMIDHVQIDVLELNELYEDDLEEDLDVDAAGSDEDDDEDDEAEDEAGDD